MQIVKYGEWIRNIIFVHLSYEKLREMRRVSDYSVRGRRSARGDGGGLLILQQPELPLTPGQLPGIVSRLFYQ